MANKNNLLLLLERPTEPIFIGKGEKKAVFDVPENYLSDRYRDLGVKLSNRFGDGAEHIQVKPITLPDISFAYELDRREQFTLFMPRHSRIAGRLIEVFMGMRSLDDLQSISAYCRDRINPFLFNYALSVAILHRPDTEGLELPTLAETFPEKFVDGEVFARAREEIAVVPEEDRVPLELPIDFTASDLEVEHRLAYFREDLGVNLHHWHWHLIYPNAGPRAIVAKDRRGELFFYMHQQIMARYNLERFSNGLQRVRRLMDWRAPVPEGYFSKLDSMVSSRSYPSRPAHSVMRDLNRELDQIRVDIDDMNRWRDRIFDAIHSGSIRTDRGETVALTEMGGIDILGDIIEASSLTPNAALYGNFHNMGHMLLSFIHDPDHRHLESFSPVGDSSTAMRDPAFYALHSYVDDMFHAFKATIPRYTVAQLNYPGVTVQSAEVRVDGVRVPNQLQTFWQKSDVNLQRGMDFQERGNVFVRFTHLQHQPFTYNIVVNNSTNAQMMGTCRIYLGPKFDERGLPMLFRDQKNLFIELDKFTVRLNPGNNTVTRRSVDTSLTIPFERTFRDLQTNRPTGGDQLEQFNYCGCGWPHHMLIPKGTFEGMQCQLFVMISNYADDFIEQNLEGRCTDAASFCGIKDRRYPDRRSMGYPFDRYPRTGVETLAQFITPNMRVQDVVIRFNNRTIIRGQKMTF